MKELYLGDGVYAVIDADNGQVWLDVRGQLELSIGPTGIPGICLEPQTIKELLASLRNAALID